ncbi:calmodulin-binding protein [Actinomadura pelletieri]|uniref:BP74-related protein n=1 Tax=Actinomadura pelletieri TaxID=111805 RepID=UPI001FE797C5|nr:calmodulin-binding protein [Actinomadura pelletieri]
MSTSRSAPRQAMSHLRVLAGAIALAVVAPLILLGGARPAAADPVAYFVFTDITRQEAVVQLTDSANIEHARALVSGQTADQPHILGRIIKRTAPYNPRWSFHYDPGTVRFFDVAIEVCDATIPYVEDHLDEAGGAFLPGLVWCPWTSRLVKEIPAP